MNNFFFTINNTDNKLNIDKPCKSYTPKKLNDFLLTKTKSCIKEIGIINITGDIKNYKIFKSKGSSFKISDNTNLFSCIAWENNIDNYDQLHEYENTCCIVTGYLCAEYFSENHSFKLNITDIKKLDDIKTKLDKIKEECDLKGYFKNKKNINWSNINNIGIISKKNTQGYNDFIKQFYLPINIQLKEISLEGKNIYIDIINAIKELQNNDLILIIRGGGSTTEISNSFDILELFDSIKKSSIPIITAIGHEDDKDDKLLITKVSDLDYPTPSTASINISNILTNSMLNKINDECEIKNYFKNKKNINWSNINNIGIISKKNTQDYNNFIKHFNLPINIQLKEISLEGKNTYIDFINAIKELQNNDLILIFNYTDKINQINNSLFILELFDSIKKSSIPVITAISHEDDKLLIIKVSDFDYINSTNAAFKIKEILIEQIINKLNTYLYDINNIFEKKLDDNKNELYINLKYLFENFFIKKFGGPILSINEHDNFIIIKKNNKFYKNIINFDQEINLTDNDIKYRLEILNDLDNKDNIKRINKNFKNINNNLDKNLTANIINIIEQIINLDKIEHNFNNTNPSKINKLYCKKVSNLKNKNKDILIDLKKIILFYINNMNNLIKNNHDYEQDYNNDNINNINNKEFMFLYNL